MKLREKFYASLLLMLAFGALFMTQAKAGEPNSPFGPSPLRRGPAISNLQIPFNESVFVFNGADSEDVVFSGNIHLLVEFSPTDPLIPNDPVLPPSPIRVHTNLMNVSGIGQSSGMKYQLNGAGDFQAAVPAASSFSFVSSYRLLPPNPIRVGALSFNIGYNVSLDSDGFVTSAEAFHQVIEGP